MWIFSFVNVPPQPKKQSQKKGQSKIQSYPRLHKCYRNAKGVFGHVFKNISNVIVDLEID